MLLFSDGEAWVRVLLPGDLGPQVWIGGMVAGGSGVIRTATAEGQSGFEFSVSTEAPAGVPGAGLPQSPLGLPPLLASRRSATPVGAVRQLRRLDRWSMFM